MDRVSSDALVDRFTEQERRHGFTGWAVEVVDDDGRAAPIVGFTGLVVPRFAPPFAHRADPLVEVGWRLDPAWWGRGIATEAAAAALAYAVDVAGLPEVVSFTTAGNRASRAVMERVGLVHDPAGDFDHPALPPDHPLRPHVLYRTPGVTTP